MGHDETLVTPRSGNRFTIDTLGLFRIPEQKIGRISDLIPRGAERLALLQGLNEC